jgi:general secretion pathway protein G
MSTKKNDICTRVNLSGEVFMRKTHGVRRGRRAFTLVEILIVVVILGILAAIVVPQFSQASSEARLNTMLGNLQTVRSQIQLFKVQHSDLLPGQAAIGGGVVEADFVNAMTSDPAYGAYVRKIPDNLYVSNVGNRNSLTCVNAAGAAPAGNEGTAWWFNAATGDFRACDSAGNTVY